MRDTRAGEVNDPDAVHGADALGHMAQEAPATAGAGRGNSGADHRAHPPANGISYQVVDLLCREPHAGDGGIPGSAGDLAE
jgi:hypothetical protein